MAFHIRNCVGTRDDRSFAVQWLACALPCRRFADVLTDVCARLGVGVVRCSFTVRDLHPLLLAGLPAHSENLHITGLVAQGVVRSTVELAARGLGPAFLRELARVAQMAETEALREVRRHDRPSLGRHRWAKEAPGPGS